MKNYRSSFVKNDYTEKYQSVMKFDKNKSAFIHQWYPFVEGYSKEFITGILDELDYKPKCCLEPFVGSGTTPVELQQLGIKCISFEVSPFMHLLASVKLEKSYKTNLLEKHLSNVEEVLNTCKRNKPVLPFPIAETLVEKEGLAKWAYYKDTFKGILDIKYAISKIKDIRYKKLFTIALASILLDVSNVFRNGKCLSYKTDWQNGLKYSRRDVHNYFLKRLNEKIRPDVEIMESMPVNSVDNKDFCHLQDVRKGIVNVPANSIDLTITSPPYLNSRDYTDIYRLELWILDLITTYSDMLDLRKRTIISHVQCKLDDFETINSALLRRTLKNITKNSDTIWNENIPRMIKGYFRDMDFLFFNLRDKMMDNKMIYFNVANSAYCNVEVRVDEIVSEIAELNGFRVMEIRKARELKSSAQQKEKVGSLQESVIVMRS